MNAQTKQHWLKALRSGKYRQGFAHLKQRDNTFCCLGVLCDVMRPDVKQPDYVLVTKLLGVRTDAKFSEKLWVKNDRERLSFRQIATYIQRYM